MRSQWHVKWLDFQKEFKVKLHVHRKIRIGITRKYEWAPHSSLTLLQKHILPRWWKGFYRDFTCEVTKNVIKICRLPLSFCKTEGIVVKVIGSILNNNNFYFYNYKACATYLSIFVNIWGKKNVFTSVIYINRGV